MALVNIQSTTRYVYKVPSFVYIDEEDVYKARKFPSTSQFPQ